MSYRAAVVGCGNAGSVHAEVLEANPRTELVGVCDPDPDHRANFENRFSVSAYVSTDDLLAEQDPDAVHICSPVQSHASIAVDVIESGYPVLVEKPLADSVEAVEEIIEARDEAGVTAGTVHNRLYNDRLIEARRRVTRGEIGDVVAVDVVASTQADLSHATRGDWVFDLPGGELGETLPHHAYLSLAFTEGLGEIRGVSTQNSRQYEEVDLDGFSLTATGASDNTLISLRALTNSSERYEIKVYGTDGTMRIDLRHTPGIYVSHAEGFSAGVVIKNFLMDGLQLSQNLFGLARSKANEWRSSDDPAVTENLSHYRLIDGFAEAIIKNGDVPVTLEDGLDTIRMMRAIE